jgi:hypothetical protein
MASGLLGKAALPQDTYVVLYTVGDGNVAAANLSVVNMSSTTDAKVRVAITTAAFPDPQDFIEFDAILPMQGGVLERTGLVIGAGEHVFVKSNIANVAARIYGYEEPTP